MKSTASSSPGPIPIGRQSPSGGIGSTPHVDGVRHFPGFPSPSVTHRIAVPSGATASVWDGSSNRKAPSRPAGCVPEPEVVRARSIVERPRQHEDPPGHGNELTDAFATEVEERHPLRARVVRRELEEDRLPVLLR